MSQLKTILTKILEEKTSKLLANNIRKGTTIFDVTGTLEEINGEERTVDSTESQQIITPSEGKNAITKITINGFDIETSEDYKECLAIGKNILGEE